MKKEKKNGHQTVQISDRSQVILIDASWDMSHTFGWGAIYYSCEGKMQGARVGSRVAKDPLQAEAMAMMYTLQHTASQLSNTSASSYLIVSDCKTLTEAVRNNCIEGLPSWKVTETISICARESRQQSNRVQVKYSPRESLKGPHMLANHLRR